MITIFTSTFNRKGLIGQVYESLRIQTCKDFEWLVVDDGSTDGTAQLFEEWCKEKEFPIRYIHQANGGKHRAINRGVREAKGELFFIVDSDDRLIPDAVEQIAQYSDRCTGDIAGLCFRKINISNGKILGAPFPQKEIKANLWDISYKYNVRADKAEVFRTDVLLQYPFPEIEGENFIPEALVWEQIADSYELWWIDKGIYLCEYLKDGLTWNFKRNLKTNPQGFALYYRSCLWRKNIPIRRQMECLCRYLQCFFYSHIS